MSGRPVEREPCHVAIIFASSLRIRAATDRLHESLTSGGHRIAKRPEGLVVEFEESSDHLENPALIALLQQLASAGVAFARDFKQHVSPADHVRILIDRGVGFPSATACGFDGRTWWLSDLVDVGGP